MTNHATPSAQPTIRRLDDGWVMELTPAGACVSPDEIVGIEDFIPAFVPGTVAQALEAAGRFDRTNPTPLDDRDAWYVLRLYEEPGDAVLRFEGLATVAEVWLNGDRILSSQSMYLSHDVTVHLQGGDRLAICFRALGPLLNKKGPRARWRPQMITPAGVRLFRTTTLGRMPGWCPEVQAVGPWRPVSVIRQLKDQPGEARIAARRDAQGYGHLTVRIDHAEGAVVSCAGATAKVVDGSAVLVLPDVEAWWPRTHGEPVLHDVTLEWGGKTLLLGRSGFRHIDVDRDADGQGFGLKVNGVPVFCRGAVWTTADIVSLPGGREDYRPWLEKAAGANMNMIRIGGTMAYERAEFFKLCDELGLMVWQELMLANFDYPASDEAWLADLKQEVTQLLDRTSASPSLAVVCGGSEVYQQAAMLGLPESVYKSDLTENILPELVREHRPDCVWVPNSPSGGAMPFFPNAGVTHYYGVGAYMRPLEDARRAHVRFAAESLAFAHVPEQGTLDKHLPVAPVHDPRWKARVPRDRGASWDFEDVRDFYLKLLYEAEPERLRRENPGLYLDLSRAVTGEVIEATFAEWRRAGSSCRGALLWTFQDLLPGPGWGLVDATGRAKPVWHAVRRAFRPVQVLLTDEGTNGIDVHVVNDLGEGRDVTVELVCLRDGAVPVVSGRRDVTLAPHSASRIPATDLFGAFFDTAYSFRFGPPSHDVTLARLIETASGAEIASAFHFPLGRSAARRDATFTLELVESDQGFALDISTDLFAETVQIDVAGFELSDNWFHLAPGRPRRIVFSGEGKPSGEVRLAGGGCVSRF
ncbi:glycoside hydrolase family 2 protein [Rhizobium sp. C1]|uniref:glycoside hydrolase family 2 protein n=1 Tax=Rhizobium sp. C1 TaxID=1349799 RepID=UPI001E3AD10A|nr:glycoside hydrolase family 2 protein [Rhizobium sp. C1]MCD2176241.1 glycoside hydrolase family 2 protein [Rhizobium sp. C1]